MMPTLRDTHRWVIDYTRANGEHAGSVPFAPDWEPARQYLRFYGLCHGRSGASETALCVQVEPDWHAEQGRPHVAKIRVFADAANGGFSADLEPDYFKIAAKDHSAELVKRGVFEAGEDFRFTVSAYPIDGAGAGNVVGDVAERGASSSPDKLVLEGDLAVDLAVEVEEESVSLDVGEASLAEYHGRCRCNGHENGNDEFPLFVETSIIVEASARAEKTRDIETGGVLVGKLLRDVISQELFAEISAFIPAAHVEASSTQLTFTADTWAAVDAAQRLRDRNEIIIGWLHTHPAWCRNCPSERADRCPLNRDFFSRDDVGMHRTCFPGAHQVALLLSDHSTGMTTSCYSWRRGVVTRRGFHLLEPREETRKWQDQRI